MSDISVRTKEIGKEIAVVMPVVARHVLMEFFQQHDVTQSQVLTALAIYDLESCRLTELSQTMNVSAPTMTGIVDRLVRAGYAKRENDSRDRRAVNVSLTGKGKRLGQKFRASVAQKWSQLLGPIDRKDQEKFLEIVLNLRKNLK